MRRELIVCNGSYVALAIVENVFGIQMKSCLNVGGSNVVKQCKGLLKTINLFF